MSGVVHVMIDVEATVPPTMVATDTDPIVTVNLRVPKWRQFQTKRITGMHFLKDIRRRVGKMAKV
eukprot:1098183-Rhodomonas_salina.1